MNCYVNDILANTFVQGSEISLLRLLYASAGMLLRKDFTELVTTPIFVGKLERFDDEEAYGHYAYSRFGSLIGCYCYEYKKVPRGELDTTSYYVDEPLLRIESHVDWDDVTWEDEDDETKRIHRIVDGEFLTIRGLMYLTSCLMYVREDRKTIYVFDEYSDNEIEKTLNKVVDQKPPEKKDDPRRGRIGDVARSDVPIACCFNGGS